MASVHPELVDQGLKPLAHGLRTANPVDALILRGNLVVEGGLVDDGKAHAAVSPAHFRECPHHRLVPAFGSEFRYCAIHERLVRPTQAASCIRTRQGLCQLELALRNGVEHDVDSLFGNPAHVAHVIAADRGRGQRPSCSSRQQSIENLQVQRVREINLRIEIVDDRRNAAEASNDAAIGGRRVAKEVHHVDVVLPAQSSHHRRPQQAVFPKPQGRHLHGRVLEHALDFGRRPQEVRETRAPWRDRSAARGS